MAQVKATQEEPEFQEVKLEITIENRAEFLMLYELTNQSYSKFKKTLQRTFKEEALSFFDGEKISEAIFAELYKTTTGRQVERERRSK